MGQHRADSVQAFIRRCWRALCDGVRAVQASYQRKAHLSRWKHLIKRGKVIDDRGRFAYRGDGSARMEQAACFGESDSIDAFRYAITGFDPGGKDYTGYYCPSCQEEKMKRQLDRAEQVRLNRITTEYRDGQLPHREQIIFDVGWLTGLVLRLSAQLEKATKEK